MSADVVIRTEGLGKKYLIGHQTAERTSTLRDAIVRGVGSFARTTGQMLRGKPIIAGDEVEEFWAIRNVNLEVHRGEIVGVIGRNGAGKSTLLKVLSQITEPSEGRVEIRGRVASLLEVGTGFHPELTGRENIYLNGAILGMSQTEIKSKFDEIVDFAEIEKFLDTPVKRYSSGMYVRLAFAVAAHLEPEILIVDEVLAVGDAEFQKKCLGKIDQVSRDNARTVLLVSHNMGVMASMCSKVFWLEKGQIYRAGEGATIVGDYLSEGRASTESIVRLSDLERPSFVQDQRFQLETLEWLSPLPLRHGEAAEICIRFRTAKPVSQVSVGLGFSRPDGTRLLTYESDFTSETTAKLSPRADIAAPGLHSVVLKINSLPLGPDIYTIDIGARLSDFHAADYLAGCSRVEIVPGIRTPATIVRKGSAVRLPVRCTWQTETPEHA